MSDILKMNQIKTISEKTSDPLKAALSYINLGIPVFPLHSPINGKCSCMIPSCSKPAKHPHIFYRTRQDATLDEKEVRNWWPEKQPKETYFFNSLPESLVEEHVHYQMPPNLPYGPGEAGGALHVGIRID